MALPLRNARLRISHGTLFWREVGHGPTLVFLHGSWSDSSQWVTLMEALGGSYHCLAPDLLGFGESSRSPKTSYSIALQVESLAEFLTGVRSQSCVVIADEIGAWVATRYALQHPDQVRGLIVSAPEGVSVPGLKRDWEAWRWLAGRWSLRVGGLWLLTPVIRLMGGKGWLQRLWQRRRLLRRFVPTCQLLFQRSRQAIQGELLNRDLDRLTCPVWILQPEATSETIAAVNETYQQLINNSRLIPVPGSDLTLWDQAAPIVQEFVQAQVQRA